MQRRGVLIMLAAGLAACASATAPAPQVQDVAASASGFSSERISVVTRGQGSDVILIPGMTSHRDVWATTADALDENYTVHLVQVNGFAGFAAQGNAEGPVSAPVAEEIARYIAENNLEQPAVIGHSMGGTIGMMLAARHPDSVGKLMVVDMFPFMGAMFGGAQATPESVTPIANTMRSQMRAAGSASPMVQQMISNMVQTESARPTLLRHARESDINVVSNAFHELIVTDMRPELANISAPLTALYVIPPNIPISAEQYEAYMRMSFATAPQARVIKVEDSYHFIMIDQFDRFMSQVNAFLSS